MKLSLADIRRLLDAFERADWEELHLVSEGLEVHVAAEGVTLKPDAQPSAGAVAAAGPAARAGDGSSPAVPAPMPATATDRLAVDGGHAVISPSPGIFWRSPAPGQPPFVEVGQSVTAASPIGIVEVMKLMNQILAGAAGTVRAVLVENGARVERGEPMVVIDRQS